MTGHLQGGGSADRTAGAPATALMHRDPSLLGRHLPAKGDDRDIASVIRGGRPTGNHQQEGATLLSHSGGGLVESWETISQGSGLRAVSP